MSRKRFYLPFVLLLMLLAMAVPVAAHSGLETAVMIKSLALAAQEETVGITPPGWLGAALAVLSLILPVVVWFWMQRERD